MKSGIYCIENLINGKKYVGQSVDIRKRMSEYHRGSHALNSAIKKHGSKNFQKYILIYCELFELNRYEIEFIKLSKSHVSEHGYNISWGGNNVMKARRHSQKSIHKMSLSHKGISPSKETRKKLSDSNKGKVRTKEQRKRISDGSRGRIFSQEARNNIKQSKTGQKNSRFGTKLLSASSKYFGVSKEGVYIDGSSRYVAKTRLNNKSKYIGKFKSEIDAALAYDKFIIENNLLNPLNFPEKPLLDR